MPLDALPPPTCGRMVITLQDNGTSRPTPIVTFDPPGRFTPGMMHDYMPHFATEIARAQAKVRYAAEHPPLNAEPELALPASITKRSVRR